MSSRRSSFDGSFVETVSDRGSNSSAYHLATSLVLPKAGQHAKHGLLSKLKHVRIGSHGKRDSANWEWRCKGEDMENFDWPPAEWSDSPIEPELEPSARHGARASSGSTASSTSVETWPDEDSTTPTGEEKKPDFGGSHMSQRQADEQAAIDALETFFARRSVSHTYAAAAMSSDEAELGIDLSVYEDIQEERPTTFIEDAPTPVLYKPKAMQPRASFLSFESTSDSSSLAFDFPVEVVDHRPKRISRPLPTEPPQLKLNLDTSRISLSSSVQSAPAFTSGPLPALPSPQKRRPSSIMVLGTVVDPISMPYSPKEIRDLSARRGSACSTWI